MSGNNNRNNPQQGYYPQQPQQPQHLLPHQQPQQHPGGFVRVDPITQPNPLGQWAANDDENINTQLVLHPGNAGNINTNGRFNQSHATTTFQQRQNSMIPAPPTQPMKQQFYHHQQPQHQQQQQAHPGDINPGMDLLQSKLNSEYAIKRELLEMEAKHAHLSQDLKDDQERIVRTQIECEEIQVKIDTAQEKIDTNNRLLTEWESSGQSTLKKRLESLKRNQTETDQRGASQLTTIDESIQKETLEHDLYSTWLSTTLPEQVKESSRDLLEQISNLEDDLNEYQIKNNTLFTVVSNQSSGNNNDEQGSTQQQQQPQATISLSRQKQHIASLRKQIDDLKHEIVPWTESLHRIQQNIVPLREYPLLLANAMLESKIPPQERREFRQQLAKRNGSQSSFDLTSLLTTGPFNSDLQLVQLRPTSQSPLGLLQIPTDTEVRVNLKLFDFDRAIKQWLDEPNADWSSNRTQELTQADEDLLHDLLSDVSQNGAISNEDSGYFEIDTAEYGLPHDQPLGQNDMDQEQDEITTYIGTMDLIPSPLNPTTSSTNPPQLTREQLDQIDRHKTLILPPVVDLPSINQMKTSSGDINPFHMWLCDFSIYLFPTYNNALRLLKNAQSPRYNPSIDDQPPPEHTGYTPDDTLPQTFNRQDFKDTDAMTHGDDSNPHFDQTSDFGETDHGNNSWDNLNHGTDTNDNNDHSFGELNHGYQFNHQSTDQQFHFHPS